MRRAVHVLTNSSRKIQPVASAYEKLVSLHFPSCFLLALLIYLLCMPYNFLYTVYYFALLTSASITQVAMDVLKTRAHHLDRTYNLTFYESTNATARSTKRTLAVKILSNFKFVHLQFFHCQFSSTHVENNLDPRSTVDSVDFTTNSDIRECQYTDSD